MNLDFRNLAVHPLRFCGLFHPKRGDLMKTFWTNIAGALLLTAGALFLLAAPVAAQDEEPRCFEYCWWEWHEECWITPDAGHCFGHWDEVCEKRCHHR